MTDEERGIHVNTDSTTPSDKKKARDLEVIVNALQKEWYEHYDVATAPDWGPHIEPSVLQRMWWKLLDFWTPDKEAKK